MTRGPNVCDAAFMAHGPNKTFWGHGFRSIQLQINRPLFHFACFVVLEVSTRDLVTRLWPWAQRQLSCCYPRDAAKPPVEAGSEQKAGDTRLWGPVYTGAEEGWVMLSWGGAVHTWETSWYASLRRALCASERAVWRAAFVLLEKLSSATKGRCDKTKQLLQLLLRHWHLRPIWGLILYFRQK